MNLLTNPIFAQNLSKMYKFTQKDRQFMLEAIRLATNNVDAGNGGPFGAVIVKNGKIIAKAANNVLAGNDPTAHAEVVAIRKACKKLNSFQLEGCDVYCSCEPCPMCFGALYWARPRRIFYANTQKDAAAINFDDAFIYQDIQKSKQDRKISFIQLCQKEAIQSFEKWASKLDKQHY